MKKTKVLASILTVMLVATAFVGCGKKVEPAKTGETTAPKGGKTIVVWSKFGEKELNAIRPIAEEWAKTTGNKVEVKNDKSEFQAYLQAANSSKGPDIMYGIPHDNLGTFQKAGLLAEVPAGTIDNSKFAPSSISAVSIGGKMYGVPLAVESIALFYNPDKVTTVPKTIDEFIETAKKVGFKYDVNNLYFTYAFISAYGGYIFKDNNGALDTKDVGLNNEGAKKGWALVQDLVQKHKLMPADIKGDIASGEFKAGKVGMYLSGSWDIGGFETAKTNFKIATLPTVDGKPMQTFLGVQCAFVNSKSKQQAEAWDLMKYMAERTGKPLFENENHRLPAMINDEALNKEVSESKYATFADQAKNAYPMPNVPEMQAVWKINDSLSLLTSGKMAPDAYGDKVVKDIQQGIANQK